MCCPAQLFGHSNIVYSVKYPVFNRNISEPLFVFGKVHFTVQTLVWSLHSPLRLMFHHSHWMNENVYVWSMGVLLSVSRGNGGQRSTSPWLDLGTHLVTCNEGSVDIESLCGLPTSKI